MNTESMIGRECSLPIPDSNKRERGFVEACAGDNELLVCIYPTQGAKLEQRGVAADKLRILKADPPTGWQEIAVFTDKGALHASLRLKRKDVKLLVKGAASADMSLDEFFNQIISDEITRRMKMLDREGEG